MIVSKMTDRSRFIMYSDEQVIACYKRLHSCNKVSSELGIATSSIHRILRRNRVKRDGLERFRRSLRKLTTRQERLIASRYADGALSGDLAREYGVAISTIKDAIRRQGGTIRPNPCSRISEAERKRLFKLRDQGLSQIDISLKLGRSQSFVSAALRKAGRSSFVRPSVGRARSPSGYSLVKVTFDDPYVCMANQQLYVLEHRLVMARHLGRPLQPQETVHHVNGDRTDNRLVNLQLRTGRHGKGACVRCLDCGSDRIGYAPIKELQ